MKTSRLISSILKMITVICSAWGVLRCSCDPNAFMGGKAVFLYFTIQSNIWICLTCLAGLFIMLGGKEMKRWMYLVKLMFTVSISLTGLVFCFMLAPTMGAGAFNLNNVLTHVIVPVAAVADFFVVCRGYEFRKVDSLYVTIPPFYYLGFSALGFVLNWPFAPGVNYPYYFLNWGSPAGAFGFCDELPFMGVFYYVAFMVMLVMGLGRLYSILCRPSGK